MASLFGGVLSLEDCTLGTAKRNPGPRSGEQLFDAAMSHMGHLRRINGADGVSGSHLIAPNRSIEAIAVRCSPCGRDKKAVDIIATLIDVHAETTPGD
jgi:hypothetical protein